MKKKACMIVAYQASFQLKKLTIKQVAYRFTNFTVFEPVAVAI